MGPEGRSQGARGGWGGGGGLFCLRLCLGCALSLIRYLWRKKVTWREPPDSQSGELSRRRIRDEWGLRGHDAKAEQDSVLAPNAVFLLARTKKKNAGGGSGGWEGEMGEVSGWLERKHESLIPGEGKAALAKRARAQGRGRGTGGPLRDAAVKSGSHTTRRTVLHTAISPESSQADVRG